MSDAMGTAGGTASYSTPNPAPSPVQSWTSGYDVSGQPGGTSTSSPFPGFNMVNNGDGTWTDTSTGVMYDTNGTALGNDSSLTDAMSNGSSTSWLSKLLGSGMGQGGVGGLGGLLSLLAPALAGIYSANKTGQATSQVLGGIQNASNIDQQLLGAPSAYAPYTQAGQSALTKLSGMNFQPLNYGPLGGRALTLGNIAAAPTAAATTKGK